MLLQAAKGVVAMAVAAAANAVVFKNSRLSIFQVSKCSKSNCNFMAVSFNFVESSISVISSQLGYNDADS